jgi:hypothetical protein
VSVSAEERGERTVRIRRDDRRVQGAMWGLAVLLLVASGWSYATQFHRAPPLAVEATEGLHLEGLEEKQADDGWTLAGTFRNGPCNVRLARFAMTYSDAAGQVKVFTVVEVHDLGAAKSRDFTVALPGYEPGLERHIMPVQFESGGQ